MSKNGPRYSIRFVLLVITAAAVVLAIWAARPPSMISVTMNSDGTIDCESIACNATEFEQQIKQEVSRRRRWLVTPYARVHVDPGVEFARVPKVLQLLASSGCEEVNLGLPPELSSKLSHPELTSKP